ncbi:MAG: tRNA pseudouridine(38-40) synthase TruA [Actinomycetaceae bacterium]|nr:tRNA pseudouridine(38-40) synthase TruA [Actinomycetaceae bacterium]
MRIRLDLAYRGTPFHGWARQPGLPTVCGALEAALSTIFRSDVELTVAGRTDTGVHARAQVAHFDIPRETVTTLTTRRQAPSSSNHGEDSAERWVSGLPKRINSILAHQIRDLAPTRHVGPPIVVHRAQVVAESFDARFSALTRHYCYRIADHVSHHQPATAETTWWVDRELDVQAMNQAARLLTGEHDFLSLCKPREGATTVRTITSVNVRRQPDEDGGQVRIEVSADAFCHSMVRSLVGVLTEVGWGRKNQEWVATLLGEPSRQHAVPIVPPHGLTLEAVDYPAPHLWQQQQEAARRVRNSPLNEPTL